jgi:hypothetical protein
MVGERSVYIRAALFEKKKNLKKVLVHVTTQAASTNECVSRFLFLMTSMRLMVGKRWIHDEAGWCRSGASPSDLAAFMSMNSGCICVMAFRNCIRWTNLITATGARQEYIEERRGRSV